MTRRATSGAAVLAVGLALPAAASEGGSTFLGLPTWIWKTANFVLFFALLVWLLGRPLLRFFDARREEIAQRLAEAREKLAEAERLREEILERLERMEREMAELRERAEREGAAEAERIRASAVAEAERFLAKVDEEIGRRTAETRHRLAVETAELAEELARELLDRQMTDEDRRRVFERSLDALRRAGTGRG